jgi:ubiquinone/menaquinone biosynthesis C-methylase UbiE
MRLNWIPSAVSPESSSPEQGGETMIHLIAVLVIVGISGLLRKKFFRRAKPGEEHPPQTRGTVIHWARVYDVLVWLVTHGKERTFRHMIADRAQLQPGERVLDVGCGTGTLALVAKERVGKTGQVVGIDPSRQMITRARRKMKRAGLTLDFQLGVIEDLTFPDQSFDVVLCTLMIHHVPDDLKRQGLAEMARVLKPGGRLLIVDSGLDGIHLPAGAFSQTETGRIPFGKGYGFLLGRLEGMVYADAQSRP